VTSPEKHPLLFIAQFDYRGHIVKIARRGDRVQMLIHPPGELFATRMLSDSLDNHENAVQAAMHVIDRMIGEEESEE